MKCRVIGQPVRCPWALNAKTLRVKQDPLTFSVRTCNLACFWGQNRFLLIYEV